MHSKDGLLIAILLIPDTVWASNFGDLPSVLPFFWSAIIISFFVALAKSFVQVEGQSSKQFRPARFIGYLILGVVCSFVLIVVLWLSTL